MNKATIKAKRNAICSFLEQNSLRKQKDSGRRVYDQMRLKQKYLIYVQNTMCINRHCTSF